MSLKERTKIFLSAVTGAACLLGWLPAASARGIDGVEKWTIRVIPLPQEFSVQGCVTTTVDQIALIPCAYAAAPIVEAQRLLTEFAGGTNLEAAAVRIGMRLISAENKAPTNTLGAGSAQTPDRAQAYSISSTSTNGILEVWLTAPAPAGLLYAARTLRQLALPPGATNAGGVIEMPAVTVADWPDIEERGFWGPLTADPAFLSWMAEFKLNLAVGLGCKYSVDTNGAARVDYDRKIFDLATRHAISPVPYLTHFDAQKYTGVYEAYPAAQGASAEPSPKPVPNLKNPDYRRIYHDWLCGMAAIPGVQKIDAWLSEGRHFDAQTLAHYPGTPGHVLETRLIMEAAETARQLNPGLMVRVMLTQGAFDRYAAILAEIPAASGALYYHGSYRTVCPGTYSQTRRKIIIPVLEQYAAKGGWLGVVPTVANLAMDSFWNCPQFVKYRVDEFQAKHLRNITAFATPNLAVRDMNFTALAEWSWNADGRSPHEFARAWAFRKGFIQPDLVADWVDAIGPVNWDLAASSVPGPRLDDAATRLARRPLQFPELFMEIRSLQHADDNLALCEKARRLAGELGDEAFMSETLYTQGYMQLVRELGMLGGLPADPAGCSDTQRAAVDASLERLAGAARQITAAGQMERRQLFDDATPMRGRWLDPLVNAERLAASTITEFAALAPSAQPLLAYLWQPAAAWDRSLFAGKGQPAADAADLALYLSRFGGSEDDIVRTIAEWDITGLLGATGKYVFLFRATAGVPVLIRSALLQAEDAAGRRETLSADRHDGYTARLHTLSPFYQLDLPEIQPGRKYFLVADLLGGLPRSTSSWENSKGIVYIKKDTTGF